MAAQWTQELAHAHALNCHSGLEMHVKLVQVKVNY